MGESVQSPADAHRDRADGRSGLAACRRVQSTLAQSTSLVPEFGSLS